MDYTNKYIPREYLALKINYCKEQIKNLPEVRLQKRTVHGTQKQVVTVGTHKYLVGTPEGDKYYKIKLVRDHLNNDLKISEIIWNSNYCGTPPAICKPQQIIRSFYGVNCEPIVMNKAFFDSLKYDSNTKYKKYKNNFFNGIYYRSAAERDIAIFYTEMGIPFKYEPEIMLPGLSRPINPDFVIYIEELDNCKFHEHLGMKDSADYLRDVKIKYGNYSSVGLIPEQDIIFTHEIDEVPFDIRYLAVKLNSAIFGTIICHEFDT
jgi:hypothetical protein